MYCIVLYCIENQVCLHLFIVLRTNSVYIYVLYCIENQVCLHLCIVLRTNSVYIYVLYCIVLYCTENQLVVLSFL